MKANCFCHKLFDSLVCVYYSGNCCKVEKILTPENVLLLKSDLGMTKSIQDIVLNETSHQNFLV